MSSQDQLPGVAAPEQAVSNRAVSNRAVSNRAVSNRAGANQAGSDQVGELAAATESLVTLWNASLRHVHPQVSAPQLRVLLVIERDEPVTLGRLAGRLGAIASSASRMCDRLQAAGLVSRGAGADRREVLLELTEEGRRVLDQLREGRRRDLAEVLARMPPTARNLLLEGLVSFTAAASGPRHRSEESA